MPKVIRYGDTSHRLTKPPNTIDYSFIRTGERGYWLKTGDKLEKQIEADRIEFFKEFDAARERGRIKEEQAQIDQLRREKEEAKEQRKLEKKRAATRRRVRKHRASK